MSKNGKYQFLNTSELVYNGTDKFWSVNGQLKNLSSEGILSMQNSKVIYAADVYDYRLRRITLDNDGNLRMYSLDPTSENWTIVWVLVRETCKIHGFCLENSLCYSNGSTATAVCICLSGFKCDGDHATPRNEAINDPGPETESEVPARTGSEVEAEEA